MNMVETIGLTKSYGKGEARVDALSRVDLTIKQGEFAAVIGPSGSGKSTLLHLLGGLDRPTEGQVIIGGKDIYKLPEEELSIFRRRQVGFIFQSFHLVPVLSAEENMLLPLMLDGKDIDHGYMEELLRILGLSDRRKHLPSELSGGQQQRVSIGRALAYKPSVILADEPTGNLDRKNSKEVLDLLRLTVTKYHQTLIVITHDLEIASQADRIIGIEDGRIVRNETVRA
ncbi:ABC transporter ATP-binding protein [Gorillibacterium sp. sgz5001074]|uniref:ABC transporter ATP-binding protein n=1 Tax=Gorillibacterium sp. sgz5001074 TaxID=3446695 RepID=UPI003F663192